MLQAAHNDPVDHCFGMISTGQKVNERWKLITLVRTLVNKKKMLSASLAGRVRGYRPGEGG